MRLQGTERNAIAMPPLTDRTTYDAPRVTDANQCSSYIPHPLPQSIHLHTVLPSATMQDNTEISEADDLAHVALAEDMKKLSANTGVEERFFGQARHVFL